MFLASFRLGSANIDEDTRSRFSKLISHKNKTISIAFVLIPILWIVSIYFKVEVVEIRGVIPTVLLLALYARYYDLHKQGLEIIKHLEKKPNQSSETT